MILSALCSSANSARSSRHKVTTIFAVDQNNSTIFLVEI